MMRVLTLSLAVMLGGCGGNSNIQVNANGGSTASASVPGYSTLGTLLSIVFLAAVSYESDKEMARLGRLPYYGSHAPHPEYVPDLDPSRRVIEYDCTKAIEDWSANLKCR